MQKRVQFRDRQELQAADLNNIQDHARVSFDDLVADAVTATRRFTGFTVSQSGNTDVTVAAGRLYDGGKVYANGTAVTRDLLNNLPVSTKRVVSIVVYGETVETNT
mgnify:CR=1 FL=1